MTKEKLEEIRSNLDLLMIAERNCGHRNEYSPSLKQRIELYNEVIRLDEAIETAIERLNELKVSNKVSANSLNDIIKTLDDALDKMDKDDTDD